MFGRLMTGRHREGVPRRHREGKAPPAPHPINKQ